MGLEADALEARYPRVGELPFSSERRMMSTIHEDSTQPGQLTVFVKGAPGVVLARCGHEHTADGPRPLDDGRRKAILATAELLAKDALRTLAVASRTWSASFDASTVDPAIEQDLVLAGLVGMMDPPRDEVRQAVARAHHAGIRAIMITGDHPVTAAVIARDLGIGSGAPAVTGAAIETMSDAELVELVAGQAVFARVMPGHKLRIVRALQQSGAVVAMTGDGVNDAPALKSADIGVAMGITGTDVSKQAADMILTDDNFTSIVAAVEEGRAIFDNIRKFLRYLLSSNIGEVLTMFLGLLLAPVIGLREAGASFVMPLLATQLLWINLVTDGAPALALGVDPATGGLMDRPPRPRGEGVITARMWSGIAVVGLTMAAGTLLVIDWSLPGGLIPGTGDIRYAQTMAFMTLTLFQIFNVFSARSDESSAFTGMATNVWLWGSVGLSIALQAAVIYVPFLQQAFSTTPLGPVDWLVAAGTASSVLWLREAQKWLVRRTDRARAS